MIKNILYVEDGSVDLDELKSTLTNETKIIVYRQGSYPPTLVQPRLPINDISSEAEFTGKRNTIEDLSFLVANAIINNSTAEETAEYLYKHNYRKQSETVKEFAEKLLDKINNGGWSEDNIYRQGQQAMAGWVTKYIADLVEQYSKEVQ